MMFLAMICSSILQQTDVSEIGRHFSAADFSPFLHTGETLAVRQSAGTSPVSKDFVSVRGEARSHQLVL
jgi:hypothetical protein